MDTSSGLDELNIGRNAVAVDHEIVLVDELIVQPEESGAGQHWWEWVIVAGLIIGVIALIIRHSELGGPWFRWRH